MPSPLPPEPPDLEVAITLGLGLSVLSFYYNGYAQSLKLTGRERVLDFGSGSGACSRHIARILRRGGGRLTCVDISQRWQQVARRTLRHFDNVAFHCGRLSDLALPAASFDIIVVHFVLHDVPAEERPGIFHEFARLLVPGGRLLVREPSGRGLEAEELTSLAAGAGLTQVRWERRRTLAGEVIGAEIRCM